MITQSTHQPTNGERLLAWRFRKHRHEITTGIWNSVRQLSDDLFGTDTPGRDGTGQAPNSRGPSRSFIGRAFYYLASLIGLATWFAGIFAVTYIIGALMEPVEPETRCFTNAIGETYCREQFVWEAE